MGTKIIMYVLVFDILLSLMIGAYAGIASPSIPATPTQQEAQIQALDISICVGIPKFTLIPSFTIPGLNAVIPAVVIPDIPFFSFNFGFFWPVFYIIDIIIWIFTTLFSVLGWLISVFTGSVSLMTSVPVLGPFLTTFVLLVNIGLVWELIKLIRGTEI